MGLAVTLYRHRLALLALLALGALFIMFTRSPAGTEPSSYDKFKAPSYNRDDIRWIRNRQRQRPTTRPQRPPTQTKEAARPPARPAPSTPPRPADVPPKQVEPKLVESKLAEGDDGAEPEQSKVEQKLRELIKRSRVMVFSKTYCPYSRKAKALLAQYRSERGLEYSVLEVDMEADPAETKQALGRISARFTFPNVFVDGQSIGGSDELSQMHANGELAALFADKQLIV
ncbi:hypothetical protein H4S01_002966 [Coemansia sp. RSA 2610]|nr:hypothetical protein IWW54_002820 [Coemansia sp. RSA 2705]KAJ2365952.1 hypothetical protein H4S01_002966 [Coemansia sp. RSA 2610]